MTVIRLWAGRLVMVGFLFADDFVFHYYNSHLPELAGDYHGLEGLRSFFERLKDASDGAFHVQPISLTLSETSWWPPSPRTP